MTNDEALSQIAQALGGPIGNSDVALVLMLELLSDGIAHDNLVDIARRHDGEATVEDMLYLQTVRGRRAARQGYRAFTW